MKKIALFCLFFFLNIMAYTGQSAEKKNPANQLDNMLVLAKVWGFVKYYHPEIAKGNVQWDHELFRVMPKVLQAGNTSERNTVLLNWL